MSKESVEKLLLDGGADKNLRTKYNIIESKEEFVATANKEGYEFTIEELDEVLHEEQLSFDSFGNPRTRSIWLR